MRRIIEILKEFQNGSKSVSLILLKAKFSLTTRTLQKDIQRINFLLSKYSNCKIIKHKETLILVGEDCQIVVNNLLEKIFKFSNNTSKKIVQLFFFLIWQKHPLSNKQLISLIDDSSYNLKHYINLLNDFFHFYKLNINLKFKVKKGWILFGDEKDLRILITNTLINFNTINKIDSLLYSNIYLSFNLSYMIDSFKKILLESNIYNYYFCEIIYFLVVIVKRIKVDKILNTFQYHFLLEKLINSEEKIQEHCNEVVNLLEKNFALKINKYEIMYLKCLMLFNQRNFDNKLFFKMLENIKNLIYNLIFKNYGFNLKIKEFKLLIDNFFEENYLKLLFNFYKNFDFDFIKNSPFLIDDSYFYSWEILSIIDYVFKKFKIYIDFNLFINEDFLINFNNIYLQDVKKTCLIPLYYQNDTNRYYPINRIVLFIKHNYSNIILKSLNINNNIYKLNYLNKEFTILLNNEINFDLKKFKNLFVIKYDYLKWSKQLPLNLDLTIKKIMLSKINFSILVFDFFLHQKFSNLKSFLFYLQNVLTRKFKINWIDFSLKNAFLFKKFLESNILLIQRLIPLDNIELPIILIYLKNPIFLNKEFKVHFVFVLCVKTDTLYYYHWIIYYLSFNQNKFKNKIINIKNLYELFVNF